MHAYPDRHHRLRRALDRLYDRMNRREYIYPDPLWPVLEYSDPRDQEAAALLSAALAFGNVRTILGSYARVTTALRIPPAQWHTLAPSSIARALRGFRHRYVGEHEMAAFIAGLTEAQRAHGTLAAAFQSGWRASDPDVLPALARFQVLLLAPSGLGKNYLLPDPTGQSACKRWMMYLRWMLRSDAVDPGSWRALGLAIPPRRLLIPVDTHMLRTAQRLGLTRRTAATLATARELTAAYAALRPSDPVRYDFAVTRLGIHPDFTPDAFIAEATRGQAACDPEAPARV
ncbi:MAG: TIGR02757 family protein [Candidatus Hydrogenedens sp.]|nr:TIGR02757 family protein [Candidatus Hydrogenedens sp.]